MPGSVSPLTPLLAIGLLLIAGSFPALQAAEPLRPAPHEPLRIASPPLSPSIYVGRALVRAVYERAGLEVEFVDLPFARSIRAAEMGNVDGELARSPTIVDQRSNLIPLAAPLTQIEIVAVRHRSQPPITSMSQLRGLLIGHLNGMRTVTTRLEKDALTTVPASNEQLLELLDRGRLDVALMMERDAAVLALHHPDLFVGPVLYSMPVYHYVQADRPDIVARLSAAQDELIREGALAAVEEQALLYMSMFYREHQRQDNLLGKQPPPNLYQLP